uniref:Putative lysophosphatidylglycerol acyltransferase 1-like protein n=1 Tax=Hyalomma excavatum TaxID=257692 RepID=A0A131XAR7_9ACAR
MQDGIMISRGGATLPPKPADGGKYGTANSGSPTNRGLHHNAGTLHEMELRRLLHQVRCWLRVMFVLANNLYCIPTYLAWMWVVFYPLRVLLPPLYWAIERQLFRLLLLMVSFWSWSAEYYVDEVGEDVSECYSDRTLVLVNHQSTADVPLLMASFQGKRSVTEHLMWIMDRLFKYTNFGAVSMTHGDFFITQGKDTRNTQLQRLRDHISEVYLRRGLKWIVLFPEGGFLHKRRATSQRYARANGYPILEHVTLPRVGAMKTVLETLTSENLAKTHKGEEPIKWVVDITIGYPDMGKPLDLFVISGGFRKQCVVHMHYRRFPIAEVPIHDSEALTKWLYDRWAEKEDLLDIFYRTGRFPGRLHQGTGDDAGNEHLAPLRETPLRVDFNIVWIVLVHAFFIMSTLFHVALFRWLASLVPFW